jgi:hypothetical protein
MYLTQIVFIIGASTAFLRSSSILYISMDTAVISNACVRSKQQVKKTIELNDGHAEAYKHCAV